MTNQDNRSKDSADPSAGSHSTSPGQAGQDLRQKAEALALERASRSPQDSAALSPEEIRKTLHDLRVHQIELEMQNEELREAQAQIEAGRARYFDLYDLAPVGYFTLSKQGLILEANLTLATLLGTARKALVMYPFSHFIIKEDQDLYYLQHQKLMATGAAQECELRLVRPDGALFWAHLTAIAAQAEDGAPVCRMTVSDITERKRTEESLRESEARFRHLLQSVPNVAVQGYGPDGTTRYWNEASERLYGYTAQEAIGRNLLDLIIPPDLRGAVKQAIQQVAEKGQPIPASEVSLMRKDGSLVSVFSSHVTVQKTGQELELFCIDIDITELKQAEKDLKLAHERILTILESIDATVYVADMDTYEILFMNQKMVNVFGGNKTGDLCYSAFRKNPGPCEFCKNDQLIDKDGNPAGVCIWHDKNPVTKRDYINHDRAIKWADGRLVRMQIATDITDLKSMEAQLAQAQKMESVGRLAGGVAHDFNNMLGVILGYTDLALEKMDPGQPFYAHFQEVRKAAQRSADLTRQLLTFARKQTIAPRVIDLNETVEGMLKMLRRLIGEDIELAWLPGANLWPVKVDPSQIDQIVVNLCVNARDAIAGVGKITIETGNASFDEAYCADHPGFESGDYVLLALSDNGCGMDQETQDHLFEPFFTTKELGKGTGLGLATVFGAVKQNNGFIKVYSEPDQGTTIKIYLPPHQTGTQVKADTAAAKPAACGSETILLVEDEPAILRMTTMMLERLGYAVIEAKTPGEAIRLAHEHTGRIDLLMTDVVMPEMNGRDLAVNLLSCYPDLKRLFMSGYTADIIAHHGVLDKGVNFIQKPFLKDDLAAKVRQALGSEKDETTTR